MKLETGTPPTQGRYVAYVKSDSAQTPDWCVPKFGAWHDGRWDLGVPVYYWIGPLPPMKMPAAPSPVQEYDL